MSFIAWPLQENWNIFISLSVAICFWHFFEVSFTLVGVHRDFYADVHQQEMCKYANSGVTLLFEHLPSRASEIDYFFIFSRPQ